MARGGEPNNCCENSCQLDGVIVKEGLKGFNRDLIPLMEFWSVDTFSEKLQDKKNRVFYKNLKKERTILGSILNLISLESFLFTINTELQSAVGPLEKFPEK